MHSRSKGAALCLSSLGMLPFCFSYAIFGPLTQFSSIFIRKRLLNFAKGFFVCLFVFCISGDDLEFFFKFCCYSILCLLFSRIKFPLQPKINPTLLWGIVFHTVLLNPVNPVCLYLRIFCVNIHQRLVYHFLFW